MLKETLIALQKEMGDSDAAFARYLGVPRTTWLMARRGERPLGPALERAAVRTFPHLLPLIRERRLADLIVPADVAGVASGHEQDRERCRGVA